MTSCTPTGRIHMHTDVCYRAGAIDALRAAAEAATDPEVARVLRDRANQIARGGDVDER